MQVIGFRDASPASIILQHLQRQGQATIKELQDVLGVSATAVREHMAHLQANELVKTQTVRYGPGRPRLVYMLTEKAQVFFPKHYDLLISLLLQEIASQEGLERVEQLLDRVSIRLAREYSHRINADDVKERLNELRGMLESKGIAAEIQSSGDSLQIFSCPYHDVAQTHGEVCRMDQRMIEQLVGQQITLQHSIREGHRSCCFTLNKSET